MNLIAFFVLLYTLNPKVSNFDLKVDQRIAVKKPINKYITTTLKITTLFPSFYKDINCFFLLQSFDLILDQTLIP